MDTSNTDIIYTDIRFNNIDYRLVAKYIAICMTEEEQRTSEWRDILPKRTTKNGVKPGITSKSENNKNWRFPVKEPTEYQKKLIFATMMMIGVLEMMKSHLYMFNNKIYLQQAGGPIGLWATCVVARVVMNFWDKKEKEKMETNNIKRDLEDRTWTTSGQYSWPSRRDGEGTVMVYNGAKSGRRKIRRVEIPRNPELKD